MPSTLIIDPVTFSSRYISEHENKKSARRTREWTIPSLKRSGVHSGRILSVGCANGIDVVEMRKNGYESFGIDMYPPDQTAAQWCQIASASAIPFADQSFDAIVMLDVIEHIPHEERPKVGMECLRVLRPGGIVILATPNRLFPVDEHGKFGIRIHSPFRDDTVSAKDLERLFRGRATALSWKKYFVFEGLPIAKVLKPFMPILDLPLVHRSLLNPHLFLALRPAV
jgi:SAM-dependent methyltransferase